MASSEGRVRPRFSATLPTGPGVEYARFPDAPLLPRLCPLREWRAAGDADVSPLMQLDFWEVRKTAAKRSVRIAADVSIRDVVSHTPAELSCLRWSRVPEVLPKTLMASIPAGVASPTATPYQGVAGRRDARTS